MTSLILLFFLHIPTIRRRRFALISRNPRVTIPSGGGCCCPSSGQSSPSPPHTRGDTAWALWSPEVQGCDPGWFQTFQSALAGRRRARRTRIAINHEAEGAAGGTTTASLPRAVLTHWALPQNHGLSPQAGTQGCEFSFWHSQGPPEGAQSSSCASNLLLHSRAVSSPSPSPSQLLELSFLWENTVSQPRQCLLPEGVWCCRILGDKPWDFRQCLPLPH